MVEITTYIGKCNFRGNQRVFGIKQRDRRQHLYVIGKTGTGKTALLKNLALQDIRAGHGVCIIDPHGEFVEEVTAQIPSERINDVVYFNPVDSEYPIGFNVLEVPDMKYKHLVVSDLIGIFTKIWANVWSARMEYILQNCILALLDTPGTTLLGVPRILTDKDYRQRIVARVKDPVVKSFWIHEFETWRDQFRNEAIVPIQNKVGQFLNTPFIRNIVGQSTSSLRIPEIMNEGKVLLVNVSKGRIGEDNAALLGAMIITKVQLASMERVRIAEEDRVDFYLYVDEFQNFATDSFAAILSEARKYRLNIIIAHQYVGQLVTDVSTKVQDAVFGNVGTMISFRVGATDAEFLEKEFFPEFTQNDIINLPNYHVYLKLMVDGVTSRPFSAVTLPPLKFELDPSAKEKIITVSRERYGRPRAYVEEQITRWGSGIGEDDLVEGGGTETVVGTAGGQNEAVCWNCGKKTTVPFKPDGKRPVYCQTCYKQIEEGKLVPIHKRMPQIGREKYAGSLGGLGIEFKEEAMTTSRAAPRVEPPPQAPRGEPPRVIREERFVPRRDRSFAGPSQRMPLAPHERRETSSQSMGIRSSRPVVRGGVADARPLSLSALKTSDGKEGFSAASAQKPPKRERTSVDVSALRKILDESLQETQETTDQKKEATTNGSSVMKPGESVKL
ncbi:MAG: hypothetical protein A3C07_03700 [Candidatus Sungbacteria bacterium RIFCSPHIGHO2_02_FULL_47_11]|uniref:Type IV secretion system coupling protein TraD DNA-binding domain-containing protein n=1 Tax=Candidatus Sungbacteria bacterium RIFCSPHIGHO2_02_FULL_47_11 TaxID=1802270 RepID=A0A1G2KLI1_9BACT|nr:MAG: hypothetical protein A3C07_03700 [Candidatus Sungbacteria bacterium RIFCSPHIGHO2_02_FULL_47_11]